MDQAVIQELTRSEWHQVVAAWANLAATILIAGVVYLIARKDARTEQKEQFLNRLFTAVIEYKYTYAIYQGACSLNLDYQKEGKGPHWSPEYITDLQQKCKLAHVRVGGFHQSMLYTLSKRDVRTLLKPLENMIVSGNQDNAEAFDRFATEVIHLVLEMSKRHSGLKYEEDF